IEHSGTTATETAGNGDGLICPGETFSIQEAVHNATTDVKTVTGINGTLTTSTTGVTLGQTTSAYPYLDSDANGTNVVPFSVKVRRVLIGKITHGYVSDLKIELVAPDGTTVLLVDRRGADGNDFVDTVFTSDPSAPSITTASAPFTGTFRPEGDLRALVGKPQ